MTLKKISIKNQYFILDIILFGITFRITFTISSDKMMVIEDEVMQKKIKTKE
jgi:hypothetical protein